MRHKHPCAIYPYTTLTKVFSPFSQIFSVRVRNNLLFALHIFSHWPMQPIRAQFNHVVNLNISEYLLAMDFKGCLYWPTIGNSHIWHIDLWIWSTIVVADSPLYHIRNWLSIHVVADSPWRLPVFVILSILLLGYQGNDWQNRYTDPNASFRGQGHFPVTMSMGIIWPPL